MRALLFATFCMLFGCGGGDGAADPCAACGPGTVCVQRLADFPSRCDPGRTGEVRCVVTSLQCSPRMCTPECQTALCEIHNRYLIDGGLESYRESCAPLGCADELPQAFLCYRGE